MSGAKVGVGVTIDPEIIIKARKRAEKANRSFSNYVEEALKQALNGHDLRHVAEQIMSLFNDKDFPVLSDIQKILKEELGK